MQGSSNIDSLRQKLLESGAVKFGDFTLTSGKKSTYYVDLKLASTNPSILGLIAKEFSNLMPENVDFIAGMELGSIPLVAALSLETGIPYAMIRKTGRSHGTGSRIEGPSKGRVVLVDDVATTGGSNLESVKILTDAGAEVVKVLVVVDREEGAAQNLSPLNLDYQSLVLISDLVD